MPVSFVAMWLARNILSSLVSFRLFFTFNTSPFYFALFYIFYHSVYSFQSATIRFFVYARSCWLFLPNFICISSILYLFALNYLLNLVTSSMFLLYQILFPSSFLSLFIALSGFVTLYVYKFLSTYCVILSCIYSLRARCRSSLQQ
jgi:hypothetical protein